MMAKQQMNLGIGAEDLGKLQVELENLVGILKEGEEIENMKKRKW